jgi:hypothetical protein
MGKRQGSDDVVDVLSVNTCILMNVDAILTLQAKIE